MFMVLITIVTGAYKPTYNWGPHIVVDVLFQLVDKRKNGYTQVSVVNWMQNLYFLEQAVRWGDMYCTLPYCNLWVQWT